MKRMRTERSVNDMLERLFYLSKRLEENYEEGNISYEECMSESLKMRERINTLLWVLNMTDDLVD